jgi:cutinase
MQQVSGDVASRVNAVVLFGDPDDGDTIQGVDPGEVDTYCADTDLICDGVPVVLAAHLSYSLYAIPAAQFVASRVQA